MSSKTKQIRGADSKVAWRAVERLQSMTGMLSQLASAVAGQELVVKVSKESNLNQTYGKIIELAPPYKLGLDVPHDFSLCNRYTPAGKPQCEACNLNEEVMGYLYHEIGHHLGKSFVYNGSGQTAGEVALVESEYLKSMSNITDDVRCNSHMIQIRPGLARIILGGLQEVVAQSAIDVLPIDIQLMVVANCDAEDIIFNAEQLHDDVAKFRELPEYRRMVSSWPSADNVWDSLTKAREFIALGKSHGFFLTEEDFNGLNNTQPTPEEKQDAVPPTPEDQPEPTPETDQDAKPQTGEEDTLGSGESSEEPAEDGKVGGDDEDQVDGDHGESGDGSENEEATDSDEQGSADSSGSEDSGQEQPSGEADQDADVQPGEAEDSQPDSSGTGTIGEQNDVYTEGECVSESDVAPEDNESEASSDEPGESVEGSGSLAASSTGSPSADAPDVEHGDPDDAPDATGGHVGPEDATPDPGATDPERAPEEPSNSAPTNYQDWLEEHGSVDDLTDKVDEILGHGDYEDDNQTRGQDKAIETAVEQQQFFDAPSKSLSSVRTGKYQGTWQGSGVHSANGNNERYMRESLREVAVGNDVITPNVSRLRYVLAENDRAGRQAHLKSGKVNARVLGKRAPLDDPRLFFKKTQPKKRDYTVIIAIDCTGSTTRDDILRDEKAAALAMCEMLNRLHIPFVVYAHTGNGEYRQDYSVEYWLEIYEIKSAKQQWQPLVIDALGSVPADGGNFDGHALQYMRKRAVEFRSTDKLIMYFSDGSMFSNDSSEQKRIFMDELSICKKNNTAVTVVEVQNDEAERLGVETVRYDGPSDIPNVIQHIARHLEGR